MPENKETSLAEMNPEEPVTITDTAKKSGSGITSVILILVLLIIASLGGYYLWEQQQQALQKSQLQLFSLLISFNFIKI